MAFASWRQAFFRDLGYALRQFVRNPTFTLVAVISLGVGIGANTAIFRILNEVMLKALPVPDPNRLVILTDPNAGSVAVGMLPGERRLLSYVEFVQLRDRATTLSGICAAEAESNRRQVRIAGGPQETSNGRLVSENYFSVLGVKPSVGRLFAASEAKAPGEDPYVVLSHEYWLRRFGGKKSVLGTSLRIYGTTLTVIGVAAPGFDGTTVSDRPDFWIPMMMQPLITPGRDWLHEDLSQSLEKVMWLHAFGRLKPEASRTNAQTEVEVLFRNILEAGYPSTLAPEIRSRALNQHLVLREASSGAFVGRNDFGQQLLILLAASAVVLLIACANVANLLLARATARGKEICVRLSVGATRMRLIRQLLTESLMLALLGGAAGLLVAWGGGRGVAALLSNPKNPLRLSAGLDLRILLFTAAVAFSTGVLFGTAPAFRATRVNLNDGLRETGRGFAGPGGRLHTAKGLVATQVALSMLLVVGAGLFLRTVWKLQSVTLGYAKERLLMLTVDGVTAGYKGVRLANLWHDLAVRLGEVPGVRAVSYSENGLMAGPESGDEIDVEGFTPLRDDEKVSRFDMVGAGYFSTVGITMLLGREIGTQDTVSAPHVCVINESFARFFFSGRNPIGRHVTERFGNEKNVMEVVGVAGNVHDHRITGEVPPRFYVAMDQGMDGPSPWAIFEVRTSGEEEPMVGVLRKAILDLNPDVPIEDVRSLQESVNRMNTQPRMIARLCTIFGGAALLLAATGLYGVLSYSVARRRKEIGIRIALGAGRGRVVALVLREMAAVIFVGLTVGVILTGAGTRLVASRLYGLSALDPRTMIFAACILTMAGLVAAYVPALRAATVNPMKALRHE